MVIAKLRSVKSSYELEIVKQAGEIHKRVLEERVPEILEEGMTEAELATRLFSVMVEEGHQGISRFSMFDTEMVIGHICLVKVPFIPHISTGREDAMA